MRKSFELLDWMKEHFKGEGGKPSVLYRFTGGLKEQGGTVTVDAGNGVSVNEHTKMLEVPVGEHLSYTSQGIDAKEGDTSQKGVVQLTDAIEAHADHTTAATPAAVKEYVDANVVIGGGEGKTYTFQEPLAEHLGAVSVADASKSAKGVVKIASAMTDPANPATAADVKAYVDAKPSGKTYKFAAPLKETGGSVSVGDASTSAKGVVQLTDAMTDADKAPTAAAAKAYVDAQIEAVPKPSAYRFAAPLAESSGSVSVADASKSAKGVVKIAATMDDAANPAAAADVKKYVDANSSGSSYTFDSPLSESQGRVTVAKADARTLGVVKLTHEVSRGEHPNEAVTPDGVAAYVGKELYNMPVDYVNGGSNSIADGLDLFNSMFTMDRIGSIVFLSGVIALKSSIASTSPIVRLSTGGLKLRPSTITVACSCGGDAVFIDAVCSADEVVLKTHGAMSRNQSFPKWYFSAVIPVAAS